MNHLPVYKDAIKAQFDLSIIIFLHIYLLLRKANDISPYILPRKTTNQNVRFISQHSEIVL